MLPNAQCQSLSQHCRTSIMAEYKNRNYTLYSQSSHSTRILISTSFALDKERCKLIEMKQTLTLILGQSTNIALHYYKILSRKPLPN